jgi:hypothetical protein
MASTTPIPPSVAALFARRTVVAAQAPGKQRPAERKDPPVTPAPPPPRHLRRGSLLNILV